VAGSVGDDMIDMRHLFGQVAMAASQVASVGTEAQIESARQILILARRNLYGILASDEDETPNPGTERSAGQDATGKQ
jgi:hypothetical protein